MFIGRETELKALHQKYTQSGFQMAVIYGRRRVGKTALINHFMDECECQKISFVALERSESDLLALMENAVLAQLAPELLNMVHFDSFEKIFDFITKAAEKERVIFLIDEYPYLAKECKYMNSLIQKYVDYDWKKTNLYLILCGSFVSFMRDEVIGEDAPLHGRSTLEFMLKPFNYLDSSKFVPDYSAEDKAIVYGLTNGVAKYLEQFDPAKTLDENIVEQFFSSTGYFSEEQIKAIITNDRSNPGIYNSIISAIANGKTRFNDIKAAVKEEQIAYYMNILVKSDVIEKRESGNKPYYAIIDGMLNFWFGYVSKGSSLINAGRGNFYYEQYVRPKLHAYMVPVFEEMAKQYVCLYSGTPRVPAFVMDVREYQTSFMGKDKKVHNIEIDLLGTSDQNIVLVGECKFKNEAFDMAELRKFLDKVQYLKTVNPLLMLFSLSGFKEDVKKNCENAVLVNIEDMYEIPEQ
ncbi:MAG: ATP-binding protein [Bulleidia sp.]|nr:ATP-binding protein [Bulleidia sp.]